MDRTIGWRQPTALMGWERMLYSIFFYPPSVYPPPVRDGEYFGTSLRWCPHRRYFANNLRCWAHLNQASAHLRCTVLRPNPRRIPVRIRTLRNTFGERRTCGARRFGFVLTHKVLRLTHGVLTVGISAKV